jgi:hypothetical protein
MRTPRASNPIGIRKAQASRRPRASNPSRMRKPRA